MDVKRPRGQGQRWFIELTGACHYDTQQVRLTDHFLPRSLTLSWKIHEVEIPISIVKRPVPATQNGKPATKTTPTMFFGGLSQHMRSTG